MSQRVRKRRMPWPISSKEQQMTDGRKLVSMKALTDWMTAEARKFEDCEECEITSVYRLDAPDEDGCNWSVDGAYNPEAPPGVVAQVVERARKLFVLE